ncbi:hypothetical protein POM88_029496 [Heracleum sosnowskyi]|uniref:Uncharacterized protein n=1 Tax=Heracleum sosnowskyi TaxID=360622 RepID=A0AAD8HVV7_9APIA|nr:hypothetical protein POM88_029496 [Heracleum sosnowskyi]
MVESSRGKIGLINEDRITIRLVSVINKVLRLHNGPVLKFTLMLPQGQQYDGRIISVFVDQWIPLLSRKGLFPMNFHASNLKCLHQVIYIKLRSSLQERNILSTWLQEDAQIHFLNHHLT